MDVRARTGQAGHGLGPVGAHKRTGDPSKRVNIARSLHLAGGTVSAVLPVARQRFADAGYGSGLGGVVRGIGIGSPLRTNVTVVDESGITANFNSRPAPLEPGQWSGLCEAVIDEVRQIDADWFVLGGTLPLDASTGLPVDVRPLFARVRGLGVSICLHFPVDCAVLSTWSSGGCPHLVKPNAAELSKMTGTPVRDLRDFVVAAGRVRESGVDTALSSLGSDGILEVGPRGILWASGPRTEVDNTIGAGGRRIPECCSSWFTEGSVARRGAAAIGGMGGFGGPSGHDRPATQPDGTARGPDPHPGSGPQARLDAATAEPDERKGGNDGNGHWTPRQGAPVKAVRPKKSRELGVK